MSTLMSGDVNEVERLKQAWSDFEFPSLGCNIRWKLKEVFPTMAKIFINKDSMSLQKCISSSMVPSLNIEDVLKSEVVAMCVFLLFIQVPPPIKEASASALASISALASTSNSLGFRGFQDGFDQVLVLDVLGCGSRERSMVKVQKQVCLSISLLALCSKDRSLRLVISYFFNDILERYLVLQFSPAINDGLLQLIRDPSCSPKLTFPLLRAIANIALVSKDMTEKIFKAEVYDCWLGKLMEEEHNLFFVEAACFAVACIASYACREENGGNTELWEDLKSRFVPVIVNKCFTTRSYYDLIKAGALALLWITRCAKSPEQMDDLVNGGCLEAFFRMNTAVFDNGILRISVEGIKTILKFGDDERGAKYNRYAKMVDDYEYGWDILDAYKHWEYYSAALILKADEILFKYCP